MSWVDVGSVAYLPMDMYLYYYLFVEMVVYFLFDYMDIDNINLYLCYYLCIVCYYIHMEISHMTCYAVEILFVTGSNYEEHVLSGDVHPRYHLLFSKTLLIGLVLVYFIIDFIV